MLRKEYILCLAAAEWEGMWARAQQLMSIFARWGNKIIYVDPPITYISHFKNPSLKGKDHNFLRQVNENIWVYVPPVTLPFGNMQRAVNRINQGIILRGLKRVYHELGERPTICWTYLPGTVDMVLPLDTTLVYDCADEHTAFPGLINKDTVSRMERELFKKASVSFASAAELYRRKKEFSPQIMLAPNAADIEHFGSALREDLALPEDIASLTGPVIGYVGAVSAWLDQEMLLALAKTRPDWTVVLVGPVDTDVSLLETLPNVHFLGRRSYDLLPAYLKGFDVAVIPFKINELTRGVNPVKLYEYLAAGKPVVSSGLPEVSPFAPLVAIARSPEEFLKKVEEEMAANSTEKLAGRLNAAAKNSWASRAADMEEAIERQRKIR